MSKWREWDEDVIPENAPVVVKDERGKEFMAINGDIIEDGVIVRCDEGDTVYATERGRGRLVWRLPDRPMRWKDTHGWCSHRAYQCPVCQDAAPYYYWPSQEEYEKALGS